MIKDNDLKEIRNDQGVIDQRLKKVEQPEVIINSEMEQKKRELEDKLDQALMNDEPTANIHREIESIERQIEEQQRLKQLQQIEDKKVRIKEQKKKLVNIKKNKDQAIQKINDELLPELEEKKQEVHEVEKKLNKARNDIHRYRMTEPEVKRKISDLNKELQELESSL
jgi:chromosome segregation ATPase